MYAAILIVFLSAAAVVAVNYRNSHKSSDITDADRRTNADKQLQDIKNEGSSTQNKREYAAVLADEGRYNDAKDAYLAIIAAGQGNQDDAVGVMNICTLRQVSGQVACLTTAEQQVLKFKDSLTFNNAYAAGQLLEQNGRKASAKQMFMRALAVYPNPNNDEYIMTQQQLTDHANGL